MIMADDEDLFVYDYMTTLCVFVCVCLGEW